MQELFDKYWMWSLLMTIWLSMAFFFLWKLQPWFGNQRVAKPRIESLASKRSDHWITFKLVLLVACAFSALFLDSAFVFRATVQPTPLWSASVLFVFFTFTTPIYLRAYPASRLYLDQSAWPAFPFAVYTDPFPMFHWGGWAGIAVSLPLLVRGLISSQYQLLFEALTLLGLGLGILLGIAIGQRFFTETTDEPADNQNII